MNTTDLDPVKNCSDWFEAYCEFHRRTPSKIAIISVSLVMIIITVVLMYLIIWYERYGADSKRILTNQLVAAICRNAIVGSTLAYASDTCVYFFAPLPKSACLGLGFARMVIASSIIMFLNAIVVSKYVFIFWLKNPGSVNDDFWFAFVRTWVFGYSVIFNFVRVFVPRKEIIYFYICQDADPSLDQHLEERKDDGFELAACILLHLVVSLRVKLFQKGSTTQSGDDLTATGTKFGLVIRMSNKGNYQ